MTARVLMLLKSHASPDMLPFSLCNKKRLAILAHEQTSPSNDTIDSVLRHQEVGRAKDLSAPPRINIKILHIIWRLKAHYHYHKSSPLVFNLTQMNPVNALTS
jgi:hypothetical protein